MRGEVLPIIPLSCLRAGGGRVSAHLGEPMGWWRSTLATASDDTVIGMLFLVVQKSANKIHHYFRFIFNLNL
ncbi:hypothetical protein Hanom_Chr11g01055781 [Helianthus anomalus]